MDHGRDRRQEELSAVGRAASRQWFASRRHAAASQRRGVVLILAVALSLTACTPAGRSSPQASDVVLTIGVPEGNVAGTDLGIRQLTNALSLEGLTQLNVDGRVLPRLAQRWEWVQDGLALRIFLQPGVKFHDGSPMTAPLVSKLLTEALARPASRAQYSSFNEVRVITAAGEYELLIELTRPSAFLPEDLELPIGIDANVGTGPYRVVSQEGESVTLQAFEEYHSGRPRIQGVTLKPFPTMRTAWTSILRGETDMVMNVPPEAVEFVGKDALQILSFARKFQLLVAFNSKKKPFDNPIVRRALNIAVDREELIRDVLDGRAIPSTGPIWPQHWAYDTRVPGYSFDPASAAYLLDGAGLRMSARTGNQTPNSRFRFTCLIPANFSLIERAALDVQKQLYNIGVDMQFEVVPARDFDSRVREGRFEAMLIEMNSGPTIGRVHNFWRSEKTFKGLNVFGYENTETERLFSLLAAATNEATIRSATNRLQRALLDDPPALFLAWIQSSRAVRREFQIIEEPGRDPLYTIWRWTPVAGLSSAVAE